MSKTDSVLIFLLLGSSVFGQDVPKKPSTTRPAAQSAIPLACQDFTQWTERARRDTKLDLAASLPDSTLDCAEAAEKQHEYQLAAWAYHLEMLRKDDQHYELVNQHNQDVADMAERYNDLARRYDDLDKRYNDLGESAREFMTDSESLSTAYRNLISSLEEELRLRGVPVMQAQSEAERERLVRNLDQAIRSIFPSPVRVSPSQQIRCSGNSIDLPNPTGAALPGMSRVYMVCR